MKNCYEQNGYFLHRNCFAQRDLEPIFDIVQRFHRGWLSRNKEFYEQGGAINSAYLTDSEHMSAPERASMFGLIGSPKILDPLASLMPAGVAFMNTQLFFGPSDPNKDNYWHRDIQYTGMSVAEQRAEMAAVNVIHCRIALVDEPGMELVPGTHRRWDTDLEYGTRTATSGRHVCDGLPGTKKIALKAGDMLVFSANMIHRGLYAPDRLALDLLYCDPAPKLLQYVKQSCLPDQEELKALDPDGPLAFTLAAMAKMAHAAT